jgi:AAA family ATP:ADP antiporter
VPMLFLFFFISFNYHLLRITKDALIITAPEAGAETIPFLKVWAILPSAIFMTFLFTKFSNRFNRENIFYMMITIFLIFFAVFILFLYPNREFLNLDSFANFLQSVLPKGFKGFIAIVRYWSYSLFYVMSESWSTIMVSLMLWGFANDTTKIPDAKRFYPLFGIGINLSGIFAGQTVSYISSKKTSFLFFLNEKALWDQTLISVITLVLFCGVISMLIYKWLHLNIFKERSSFFYKNGKKSKMSLKENLKYISKSKYLLSIALIVLSYNVIINLTEVLWKSQLRELFPSPQEYTAYMSKITFFIGLLATFASFFFTGNFIRKFGWKSTALLTPFIIILTGIGFFYFLFLRQFAAPIVIFGMTPLALTVFFGSAQNILSRASKYTVFDDTKEMAFIPLSPENRIKGKSAIDGIGSRLGKSGSSLVIQCLLMVFATPIACAPIISIVVFAVVPFWIVKVNYLNKKFLDLTQEKETIKSEEKIIPLAQDS